MNFRFAITCSLAVHVLLFGTAAAFARYGEGLFERSFRSVSVSLVELGSGSGKVSGRLRQTSAPRAEPSPDADALPESVPAADPVRPHSVIDIGSASGDVYEPAVGNAQGGDDGADRAVPGSGAGSSSGSIAPEEWRGILAAIEKAKTYPRLARERGIEGMVLVRFRTRPSGDIEQADVVRSSGSDILDEAAVRTLYRAAPMPYVNSWMEVPMSYELKR